MVANVCYEKDLKTRIKELIKYREHGIMNPEHCVPFEKLRFKRELRLRAKGRKAAGRQWGRLLPKPGDYCVKAIVNGNNPFSAGLAGGGINATSKKKKGKKAWARKKLKTGRRLLLQMGCTLTAPVVEESPAGSD